MHGNNEQYWHRHTPSRDSLSGVIAVCKSVCWFDLHATYRVRGPGRFVASLRFKMSPNASVPEPFSLRLNARGRSRVEVEEIGTASTGTEVGAQENGTALSAFEGELARDMWHAGNEVGKGLWKLLHIGTIEISDPLGADISFRMWKHSGTWVGGDLCFDYLHVQDEKEYIRSQEGRKGRKRRRSAKQSALADKTE